MSKKMTDKQYRIVFNRADEAGYEACEIMKFGVCSNAATQWHHRQLRSQGGGNEASNGLAVCSACHDWLHKHAGEAYEHGWLVHGWDEPLNAPVDRRGQWVLLDNEGGYTPEMEAINGNY